MRLADWLRTSDKTQAEFAGELGVTQSAVNRWATGRRQPSLEQIIEIERVTRGKVTYRDFAKATAA